MQQESNILPLFCTPTRPSYHESENQELFLWGKLELHNIDSVHASCQTVVYHKFGNPGSYCNCCWCCFLLVCFSLFALFSTGNLSQDRCQGNRERPCQEQRRSKRHPISGTKSCNKSELKLRRRQERQKSAYLTLKEGVLHALHLHFSFAVHSAVFLVLFTKWIFFTCSTWKISVLHVRHVLLGQDNNLVYHNCGFENNLSKQT